MFKKSILLFLISVNSFAVTYFPCFSVGQDLSISYQSCVNRNFNRIATELNVFTLNCMSVSNKANDYSYQSCVNNNFIRLGQKEGVVIFNCLNMQDTLTYNYQACVNRNFYRIVTEINSQKN